MSRQDVRIELPLNSPEGTLKLLVKIDARNTAMGINSPIKNDFNWGDIAVGIPIVQGLIKDATVADRQAQNLHYQAMSTLGIAPGQNLQNLETPYTLTTEIRDILLAKNRANPEALELWGFSVVVDTIGGKRTVTVDIPTDSPETFIQLCKDIIEQNTALGAASPLVGKIDMAAYAGNVTAAETDFNTAATQRGIKEAKHGEALKVAGYGEGQSSETPGTLYYIITGMRDLLLVAYHHNPEELSLWGFDVVTSATAMGGSEEPAPAPAPVP